MSRLVLTQQTLTNLREVLLQDQNESCAILYGRSVICGDQLTRIIVRESFITAPSDYAYRNDVSAQLRPEIVAEAAQRARRTNESLIFVHTHPFSFNEFSEIDDMGERQLADFLARRVPEAPHAALLLTPEKSIARQLGQKKPLKVMGIGLKTVFGDLIAKDIVHTRYDRQVRAFGTAGQDILHRIRVGIVGLGGTGSVVLQQLAYLGVQNFLLIEPDIVEETNLNRLVGALPSDIGLPKVEIAKTWAERINPNIQIEAIQDSVNRATIAKKLSDTDFIFCCTDSHGSRAILNQLAYQYLIPTIDMGVSITADHGTVTHIAGRTQLLAPGMACMVCGNLLNPEEIRRDLLTIFERQNDPYIIGEPEPAPSVISLNSTIASMAITMFLNIVCDIPGTARFINYDGKSGTSRPAFCNPHPTCVVCSLNGALARGDEWPLPARLD